MQGMKFVRKFVEAFGQVGGRPEEPSITIHQKVTQKSSHLFDPSFCAGNEGSRHSCLPKQCYLLNEQLDILDALVYIP